MSGLERKLEDLRKQQLGEFQAMMTAMQAQRDSIKQLEKSVQQLDKSAAATQRALQGYQKYNQLQFDKVLEHCAGADVRIDGLEGRVRKLEEKAS